MFDWQAKITRLLELPGLTDMERSNMNDAGATATWGDSQEIDAMRRRELSIRDRLERFIEARGYAWTMQCDRQKLNQHWAYRVEIWRNNADNYGVRSISASGGETPAQALCDAVLAALEETQP